MAAGGDRIRQTIRSWAAREMLPWAARTLDRAEVEAGLHGITNADRRLSLFRFHDGEVELLPRPAHFVGAMVEHQPRAELYLRLFRESMDLIPERLDLLLCLCLGDSPYGSTEWPVFSFQKPRGLSTILLPDVDFMILNFYEDTAFTDEIAYDAKKIHASFYGTTTGGHITADTVRALSLERLRAAGYFYDNPDVTFRLPWLFQYESEAVRDMLAALPFCGGGTVDWQKQRENRFLISMDGNGATCSRVVVSLKSNSVLLKYDSPNLLYYFDALIPCTHYLPIARDEEVSYVLSIERNRPGYFEPIAVAGRDFAETYLSRENVLFYTSSLLSLYAGCFRDRTATTPVTLADALATEARRAFDILAHVRFRGDLPAVVGQWCGLPGSGAWIEGFAIIPRKGVGSADVVYCGKCGDGSLTEWRVGGVFCGTRGMGQPLTGVCIHLRGEPALRWRLHYEARFVGCSDTMVAESGEMCAGEDNAPIEAIRIFLAPRAEDESEELLF